MRLTLRTLLAYLDDTLEPAEAKLIGQKVVESDTAQELIARIKEVTRRRRITTPTDDSKIDPNTIAEYLDNELTAEALGEVEQLALASDVHLAELASCHQILTVVLGEPAVVPPTAYKRMYGLVKPPESNPNHQAPVRREAEEVLSEGREVDETLRLGLPALHKGTWKNRLILIGATACAALLLGVAIWQVWPTRPDRTEGDSAVVVKGSDVAKGSPPKTDQPGGKIEPDASGKKDTPAKDKEPDKQPQAKDQPADVKGKEPEIKDKEPDKNKQPDVKDKPAEAKKTPPAEDAPLPPDSTVRAVGTYEPGQKRDPSVLVQLLPDKKQLDRKLWTRLMRSEDPASTSVMSNSPLVSLPGYRSVVQMDNGVRLTLWGNIPEFSMTPFPYESSVLLHPNERFDLDVTLLRGRIMLANTNDRRADVRLRFANPANQTKGEIWDIGLVEKGTEVIVNLVGTMAPGEPFYAKRDDPARLGPDVGVTMVVQAGTAELKLDLTPPETLKPPPAGPMMIWNNKIGRPNRIPTKAIPYWLQYLPPLPKELKEAEFKAISAARTTALSALENLNVELSSPSLEVGLANANKSNDIQKRKLVVRASGALDDLPRLLEATEDKEPEIRFEAIATLRDWLAAAREHDYKLFDQLQPAYSAADATIVLEMLHGFSPDDASAPASASLMLSRLTHKKVVIRELAHLHLLFQFPSGRAINFNALAPEAQLRQAAAEWEKLVKKGKLK